MVELQRQIKRERNLPPDRAAGLTPEKYQYVRRLATRRETDEFTRRQRAGQPATPPAPAVSLPARAVQAAAQPTPAPTPAPPARPASPTPTPARNASDEEREKARLAAKEQAALTQKQEARANANREVAAVGERFRNEISSVRTAEAAAQAAFQQAQAALTAATQRVSEAVARRSTAEREARVRAEGAVTAAAQNLQRVRSQRQVLAIGKHNTTLVRNGKTIYTPETFKPRSPVGANVRASTSLGNFIRSGAALRGSQDLDSKAKLFGAKVPNNATHEQKLEALHGAMVKTAHEMVADTPGRWTVAVSPDGQMSFQEEQSGASITRKFSVRNGEPEVYHAYFANGGEGAGMSKSFFRNSIGVYDRFGIKKISVTANLDRGGYVWGRYGFVAANEGEHNTLRSIARNGLERLLNSGSYNTKAYNPKKDESQPVGTKISPEKYAELMRVLESSNPRDMFKIFDAKEGKLKIGAELYMGNHTFWSGVMDTRTRDYDRFKAYAAAD